MSVKIIFYELNQPDTSPQYKELIKYLMSLEDWIQPLSSVWVVDTAKSAQVIRDEAKPFLPDTDKLFVAEWYPGGGWSSRNLPNVAAEWIHMRESEQNIDQYKLPPSMAPKDPNYTPPPPPEPSQEFLEARGIIEPQTVADADAGTTEQPIQPGQIAEAQAPASDIPTAIPSPSTTITPETASDNSDGTLSVQHETDLAAQTQPAETPAAPNNIPGDESPTNNPTAQG